MKQIGWICRTWAEKAGEWSSEFDRFATEDEARKHGFAFVKNIQYDEQAREFEVYKDFA